MGGGGGVSGLGASDSKGVGGLGASDSKGVGGLGVSGSEGVSGLGASDSEGVGGLGANDKWCHTSPIISCCLTSCWCPSSSSTSREKRSMKDTTSER